MSKRKRTRQEVVSTLPDTVKTSVKKKVEKPFVIERKILADNPIELLKRLYDWHECRKAASVEIARSYIAKELRSGCWRFTGRLRVEFRVRDTRTGEIV